MEALGGYGSWKQDETRVFKGRIAKTGFIFLIVKYYIGNKPRYTNYAEVPLHGTDQEKQGVYDALKKQLKNKFKTVITD